MARGFSHTSLVVRIPDHGFEFLLGKRAPRLERLAFAVLALGDSSYPKYCETGRQVDARLAALGARRLAPLQECDVDYEAPAAASEAGSWAASVISMLPRARKTAMMTASASTTSAAAR